MFSEKIRRFLTAAVLGIHECLQQPQQNSADYQWQSPEKEAEVKVGGSEQKQQIKKRYQEKLRNNLNNWFSYAVLSLDNYRGRLCPGLTFGFVV
jgi:hypothetical protein